MSEQKVNIFPLGGVGEVGKNMWAIEYGDEIIVLDAGVMFPDEEMLGIDLVIPDISYLISNKPKVKAILLSHGHEDHIGALPYVLRQLPVPIYGTRLTMGLVKGKLEEHGMLRDTTLREVKAGDVLSIGEHFQIEFIHVNHSLVDVVSMAIRTPAGIILYATDFKVDYTPIDGKVIDIGRFAQLGTEGVLCLMSDSTNAERPGYTASERIVGEALKKAFAEANGRIIVATFASNIHRIQQIIDAAAQFGRKVCVIGRSMVKNVAICRQLGYLDVPDTMIVEVEDLHRHAPENIVVISTGSQGEPMAALTRMAMSEHRDVQIEAGDTVIISAQPIPGNERLVGRTINHLFRLGANVVYQEDSGIHVSGHANQEELKLMLNLTQPQYFMPIHGEYRMLKRHADLAELVGITPERIVIPDIGDRIEVSPEKGIRKVGRIEAGQIFVDGLGIGDVGNVVLRDRQQLSHDGILVAVVTLDKKSGELVGEPEIVSRGFVYMREAEALMQEARERIRRVLARTDENNNNRTANAARSQVRDALNRFLYEKTQRRPIILPVVMEVE